MISIRGYQFFISPLFGPCCRFYPSCSHYFAQAIKRYGIILGFYLGLKRLLKCGPWHPGGYDPIPGLKKGCNESTKKFSDKK